MISEVFQLPEVRKKRGGGGGCNRQVCIFGFHFIARNIEEQLKIDTSFLDYSQIWLNIHR